MTEVYITTLTLIGAIIGALITNYFLYRRYKLERKDNIIFQLYSQYIESIVNVDHKTQLLIKAKIVILGSSAMVEKIAEMDSIAGDLSNAEKRRKFLELISKIRDEVSPVGGRIDPNRISTILLSPLDE